VSASPPGGLHNFLAVETIVLVIEKGQFEEIIMPIGLIKAKKAASKGLKMKDKCFLPEKNCIPESASSQRLLPILQSPSSAKADHEDVFVKETIKPISMSWHELTFLIYLDVLYYDLFQKCSLVGAERAKRAP
jgi:hypothetical protein